MQDEKSASLVMVAGAAGLAYWWWNLTRGKLTPQDAAGEPQAGKGGLPENKVGVDIPHNLDSLKGFANEWHLTPTSGLRPGDTHSLHSKGLALDVSTPPDYLKDAIKRAAAAIGIHVLPEEYTGTRNGARSTGPHWHLSFPQGGRF